jgi:phosphatidylglycerol:prolipoprotein diacylglycerol transferase
VTFGIFAALLWIASHKRFHGQVIVSYVALYATARFLIEFVRGDAARGTVFGVLSTSQFIAILMLLGAAAVLPYLTKKQSVVAPPV